MDTFKKTVFMTFTAVLMAQAWGCPDILGKLTCLEGGVVSWDMEISQRKQDGATVYIFKGGMSRVVIVDGQQHIGDYGDAYVAVCSGNALQIYSPIANYRRMFAERDEDGSILLGFEEKEEKDGEWEREIDSVCSPKVQKL